MGRHHIGRRCGHRTVTFNDGCAPIRAFKNNIRVVKAALNPGFEIPTVKCRRKRRIALLSGDHHDTVAKGGIPLARIVTRTALITLEINVVAVGNAIFEIYPETLGRVRNHCEFISQATEQIGEAGRGIQIVGLLIIIVDRVDSRHRAFQGLEVFVKHAAGTGSL